MQLREAVYSGILKIPSFSTRQTLDICHATRALYSSKPLMSFKRFLAVDKNQ